MFTDALLTGIVSWKITDFELWHCCRKWAVCHSWSAA